jgi:hypothetical protein
VAAKTQKTKTYTVHAVSKSLVYIDIQAKDLDEALAKAKDLGEKDFVDILGECVDGSFCIVGLNEADIDCS